MQDALDIALLVAAANERAGGEYFVGGSVASSLPFVTKVDIFGMGTAPCDETEFLRRRRVTVRAKALDIAYLDARAARLGLSALLARARSESP